MPKINQYICQRCGFTLQAGQGWGYCLYAEDAGGKRIDCYHPGEKRYVEEVLGSRLTLDIIRERTGFESFCICLDCLDEFRLDLGVNLGVNVGDPFYWSPYEPYFSESYPRPKNGRDKRVCPSCQSRNVKAVLELVGETCPKCKEGVIEEIWTGGMR